MCVNNAWAFSKEKHLQFRKKKIFHHKADVKYHYSARIPFDSYFLNYAQKSPLVSSKQLVVAVSFKLKITFRRLILARFFAAATKLSKELLCR